VLEPLIRSLGERDSLSDAEKAELARIIVHTKQFRPRSDIVAAGSRPGHSSLLLDGFAARYKLMADGSRQITALHVAGDFVDLHAFLLKTMDHGIVALSACTIGFADHGDLKLVTERHPHLTRLFWLETLIDGAIHREWIVAMGRRSKKSHLAHLVCELFVRLRAVGRTDGSSFHLPLSQSELADVLGLSVVHMNRVLQGLRREKLVAWVNHTVTILDWDRLQEMAEFDPTYLSLRVEPR
jgi:CRP-like cAMP-binding protein